MSSSLTRFLISFGSTGLGDLVRARSTIKGIGEQSYISFNAASRNMSNLERNVMKSVNNMNRGFLSLNRSMMGLGMGLTRFAFSGLAAGVNLLNRAFIQTNSQLQTNKIMIEEMLGKGRAGGFQNVMKELAAGYGFDLSETMKSSRGLLQVMKQISAIGGKELNPKSLDKVMKMVMATSAMDTENRGLSYTSFSYKEAMQGIGRGDWRSMHNRLEINMGKKAEAAITKAFQKGDLEEGLRLWDEGLKKIGIDSEKLLGRLTREGFIQNVSRLTSYITRSFQITGEGLFKSLTEPIYQFNQFLSKNFSDEGTGMAIMMKLGSDIADGFAPAIKSLNSFGNALYKQRWNLVNFFLSMAESGAAATKAFAGIFTSFGAGLFGMNNFGAMSGVSGLVKVMGWLTKLGEGATSLFNQLHEPIKRVGNAVGDLGKQISAVFNNLGISGGGIAGVMKFGLGVTEAGIRIATTPLQAFNRISGNTTAQGDFGNQAQPDNSSNATTNAMNGAFLGLGALGLFMATRGRSGAVSGLSAGSKPMTSAAVAEEAAIVKNTAGRTNQGLGGLRQQKSLAIDKINDSIFQRGQILSKNIGNKNPDLNLIDSQMKYVKNEISKAMMQSGKNAEFRKERNLKLYNELKSKRELTVDDLVANDKQVKRLIQERQRNYLSMTKTDSVISKVQNMSTGDKIMGGMLGVQILSLFKSPIGSVASKMGILLTPFTSAVFVAAGAITALGATVMGLDNFFSIFGAKSSKELITENEIENQKNLTKNQASLGLRKVYKSLGIHPEELSNVLSSGFNRDSKVGGKMLNNANLPLFLSFMTDKKGVDTLNNLAVNGIQSGAINKEDFERKNGAGSYDLFTKENWNHTLTLKGELDLLPANKRKEIMDGFAKELSKRLGEILMKGGAAVGGMTVDKWNLVIDAPSGREEIVQ